MRPLLPLSIEQIIVVLCMTALTALAAHLGKAVFHDGIRPIVPEVMEGRMNRKELASISHGLSIGFIMSVGLSFAISFQMLNPWLLLLPTDVLGIMARRWWTAMLFGAAWGAVALFGLTGILTGLATMPVAMIGPLSEFGIPVLGAVAIFPIIAILYQFGWKRALPSAAAIVVIWIIIGNLTDGGLFPQLAITTLASIVILLGFVVRKELTNRKLARLNGNDHLENIHDEEEKTDQLKHFGKIRKGLPLLMAIGSCVAIASQLGIFTGSDAAMPILQSAWQASGTERYSFLLSAALVDIIRLLCFVPLLTVTALATGVYGLVGLMLVFPIGYLSPNPVIAGLLGAVVIVLEVILLLKISRFLQRYSIIRESADYIRTAMNAMMEIGFLIGGAMAVLRMEGSTPGIGLTFFLLLYVANEALGRPVMRLAVGPVATILAGLLLNIIYFVQLL